VQLELRIQRAHALPCKIEKVQQESEECIMRLQLKRQHLELLKGYVHQQTEKVVVFEILQPLLEQQLQLLEPLQSQEVLTILQLAFEVLYVSVQAC
jgi:hypothetical protein